jgi:hypothetical protein
MDWVCVFDDQQGIEFILLECVRSKNQKRTCYGKRCALGV